MSYTGVRKFKLTVAHVFIVGFAWFIGIVFLCYATSKPGWAKSGTQDFINFLNDAERIDGLPVGFLNKVVKDLNLKLEFGNTQKVEFNRKDKIILDNKFSVDGRGGGGLKSYSNLGSSKSASVMAEMMHAYVQWVEQESKKPNPHREARRIKAFIESTLCRYKKVKRADTGVEVELDRKQQHDVLNEFWSNWFSKLIRDWKEGNHLLSTGVHTSSDRDKKREEWVLERVKNRDVDAYYKEGFWKTKVWVAKENHMSFHEMRVLMRHVLGLKEQFIEKAFKSFKRPFERKKFCVSLSMVLVLDASGSMKTKIKGTKISMLDKVKNDIAAALDELPNDGEVTLIVFRDCKDIRVEEHFTQDAEIIKEALKGVKPSGSTPIADAFDFAIKYIETHARGRGKKFLMLTDGTETCGGNPVDAVKKYIKRVDTRE